MLNQDLNENVSYRKLIDDMPYAYISRAGEENNGPVNIVMTSLSKEEEKFLESNEPILIKRGEMEFVVEPKKCYGYGDINLSPNSDDIKSIEELGWFDYPYIKQFIPTGYDYNSNSHPVTPLLKRGKWFDTSVPSTFLPYLYASIGKPDRIVIFKYVLDYEEIKKKKYAENKKRRNKERYEEILANKQEKQKKHKTKRLNKLSIQI